MENLYLIVLYKKDISINNNQTKGKAYEYRGMSARIHCYEQTYPQALWTPIIGSRCQAGEPLK